jgi:hypothetical protein
MPHADMSARSGIRGLVAVPPTRGSAEPGGRDENRLEVHDERAAVFIDRRPDGVEQTASK